MRPNLNILKNKKPITLAISVVITLTIAIISIMSASNAPSQEVTAPDYQTIIPLGKTVNELGGWKRVSPLKSDPVFAYTDSIDGATISVSEQPLPRAFIEDVDLEVSNLAKQYNATDILTVGAVKVYVGTSSEGPQSVIFTKNNLLILIKSKIAIPNDDWSKYIASLR